MSSEPDVSTKLRPYAPRMLLQWLSEAPGTTLRALDGTVVFVDISGFTKMSERLARHGKVGAEEVTDVLGAVFARLLSVAYGNGGGLIKFGGDALLLFFSGADHQERAARAAVGMRRMLREVGKIQSSAGLITLRMSVGVHSGTFHFFLVGDSHRELVVTGPAASETVHMEGTASAGEILVSAATAAALPAAIVGAAKGDGFLLKREPPGISLDVIDQETPLEVVDLLSCIPMALREDLLSDQVDPEHRQVTVAFIHFDGIDRLVAEEGAEYVAYGLDQLVTEVQRAADKHGVTFLGTDVDHDGGKIILTAGAPHALGDDEERMLLTVRTVMDSAPTIPIRIGVNHGPVFAGDIGPHYRRTYTVMGDTVNLAARLMAQAPPGEIYASGSVLERSATRFETVELEPFMVKGKAKPVQAWAVGAPLGRPKHTVAEEFPLHGRREEMRLIHDAVSRARNGERRTVVFRGEAGLGKTRLLDEALKGCSDFVLTGATGETFTATTPYIAWRDVLRELIGVGWEDPSEPVIERLRELVEAHDPSLLPWLPLIATAADAEMDPTPEVASLGVEFRRPRLHEAVIGFLRAIRTEPTLFAFEDAHLMDEASADLLTAIATDERADRPWLIVALRRPEGEGLTLVENESLVVVDLEPMDPEVIAALADTVTDEAPLLRHVLAQIVERSNGNPQLLLDLIRAAGTGDGSLPDSVEAAATVRIDSLAPRDRQLVRRLSVFGLAFHPRSLEDVLDESSPTPDQATWERLAEFFAPDGGGSLRFRRAVIRDAAYEGLPFRTRQRLHLAVGLHFERESEEPDENAGLLSLHFSLGAEHAKAWRYARVAGDRARDIFANVEAARLYGRALEAAKKIGATSGEMLEVTESLGEVLWRARLYREALRANSDARSLARNDPVRLARLMMKRSLIEESIGRLPQALRWLTKGRKLLEGLTAKEALGVIAELDARYSAGLQAQGRNGEAVVMATRAIEEGQVAGSASALGYAENILGAALAILGKPGAIDHWRMALGYFEELGDLPGQAMALSNLGVGEYFQGRWSEAAELYRRAEEASERLGDPVVSANSKMNIAEILVDQGSLQEAETLLQAASRVWRATGDDYLLGFCLTQLARVNAMRGRTLEAIENLAQARELYVFAGAPGQVTEVDAREAECRVLAGQARAALEQLADIEPRLEVGEGVNVLMPLLERLRGYALFQLGDLHGATVAFEKGAAGARERGAEHDVALCLQGLARIASRRGERALELEEETGVIFGRLGIKAVPAFPMSAVARS